MATEAQPTIEELARQNAALLAALAQRDAALATRDAQIDLLAKDSVSKQGEIDRLTYKLQMLLHRLYGRRSEKDKPGQLFLFDNDEEPLPQASGDLAPDDEAVLEPPRSSKKRKPRALKNRGLPRVRVLHDLPEHEKTCGDCGAQKAVLGEAVREEYDYEPASVFIREIVRPKYACPCCQGEVSIAELPPVLIERGMAGPGLLAQIVTAKYADHLPLYRQEAIFRRHGLELSRKTMCDWVGVVADHLLAIVLAMRRELLGRPVIQADETGVMLQTNAESKGCTRAYFWGLTSPEDDIVLYEFHATRGQIVADEFLKEFRGEVLLVDGYAGYNPSRKHGVKRAGCWAHARRALRDGGASHPAPAAEFCVLIQMLYAIEKRARELELDAAATLDLRRRESRPILEEIRVRLDAQKPTVPPSSAFGEALRYLDSQWPHLVLFVDDGRIPIDNNASERAMRPIALGRKNWLFAGSIEGGRRAAAIYSIIESCKRVGVPPFEYLRDVLSRISTHPHRQIHELTPAGWKAAREASQAKAATPAT